jgi:hypothetical protein
MPKDTVPIPQWPPVWIHTKPSRTVIPAPPAPRLISQSVPSAQPPLRTPLTDKPNQKQQYRNGYVATPKQPSFTPYQLASAGHKRQRAFAVVEREELGYLDELSAPEWDDIARRAKLIPPDGHLRPLQIKCSNIVVSGGGDVCAIGPTGCGMARHLDKR